MASEIYKQLTYGVGAQPPLEGSIAPKHYDGLLKAINQASGVKIEDILDLDLSIIDTQPACFLGLDKDFISSPRLDNLYSSYYALRAIIADDSLQSDSSFVNIIVLFDHEEIGSLSAQGANSIILPQNMKRIHNLLATGQPGGVDSFEKAVQRSFVISADMAHAVHPNYASKHEVNHKPHMNQGIVIKINVNSNYATDGVSGSILRLLADNAKVPLQDFIVRQDSPCGTTIGPITAGKTGKFKD